MLLRSIARSKCKKLVFGSTWREIQTWYYQESNISKYGVYIYIWKKRKGTRRYILQMNYKRIKFPSVRSIKYSFRDVNLIFKKKKEEKREWKVIKSKLKSYGIIEIRLKIVTITFHRYPRLRENLRIYTIFIQYQKVRLNIFLRLVFRIKKRFVENIEDTSLFNRSSPPSRLGAANTSLESIEAAC